MVRILKEDGYKVLKSGRRLQSVLCECQCGKQFTAVKQNVKSGNTTSCGCIKNHRFSRTKTHITWSAMIQRCRNKKNTSYMNYGDRGIKVCEKWLNFKGFLEDMGLRPEGKTLDRIDNEKGYYKENCRWETPKNQCRNRRDNKLISFNGLIKTCAEWSEILGIKAVTIRARIRYGFPIEQVFSKTRVRYNLIRYKP